MINKQLIVEECQRRGITVTGEEVNAEIERLAKKFRIPVEQWLKMLKQERNVTPQAVRRRHHLADARPAEIGRPSAERHAGGAGAGIRNTIRRGGPRAADRGRQLGESEVIAGAGGGQPPQFRQPGQELLGGPQRQRERPDSAHPPARQLPGNRRRGLSHGRRRDLAGHPRRGPVPDSEAGKPARRPARQPSTRSNPTWKRRSANARCTRSPKTFSTVCTAR